MNKQTEIETTLTLQKANEVSVATPHAEVSVPAWTRRAVGLSMLGSAAWLAGCGGSDDTASSTGGGSGGGGSGGGSGGSGGGGTPYVNGGVVTTFAGSLLTVGTADGTGTSAQFNYPRGLAIDSSGSLYVADSLNNLIRKITAGGVVTTFAGSYNNGNGGHLDGTGTAASFNNPMGLACDNSGNLYVTDFSNHLIRKVTSGGAVTTLAGSFGVTAQVDGTGTAANFYSPYGVAVDSSGNVYVADFNNNAIRKITSAGVVTTFAGQGFANPGSADGTGTAASFRSPSGVAVDSSGNVYVADRGNSLIRKITSAGVVTTLAGQSGHTGTADGTGTAAQFSAQSPISLAVDSGGNVYAADTQGNTIRKITPAGVVTTLAGSAQGTADGTGTAARFHSPNFVAVDSSGILYVSDSGNQEIRKIA